MSEIKYVTPSGLTHYDEKIKEVINGKDKELSFDEYNALSDDDKNNGTTYYVPDATLGSDDVIFSVDDETLIATYDNKTIELVDASKIQNNLTTTDEGYALDARQGKALQDKIGSTDISAIGDGTVTNAISTLNSNLNKGYIEVVADGTKTLKTILSEISNLIDYSKVNYDSKFIIKEGELIFVFSVTQLYTNCVQLSSFNIPASNMLWGKVIQLWTDNERIQYTVSTLSGDGIITLDDTLTSISKNGSVYRFIY